MVPGPRNFWNSEKLQGVEREYIIVGDQWNYTGLENDVINANMNDRMMLFKVPANSNSIFFDLLTFAGHFRILRNPLDIPSVFTTDPVYNNQYTFWCHGILFVSSRRTAWRASFLKYHNQDFILTDKLQIHYSHIEIFCVLSIASYLQQVMGPDCFPSLQLR